MEAAADGGRAQADGREQRPSARDGRVRTRRARAQTEQRRGDAGVRREQAAWRRQVSNEQSTDGCRRRQSRPLPRSSSSSPSLLLPPTPLLIAKRATPSIDVRVLLARLRGWRRTRTSGYTRYRGFRDCRSTAAASAYVPMHTGAVSAGTGTGSDFPVAGYRCPTP